MVVPAASQGELLIEIGLPNQQSRDGQAGQHA